MSDFTFDVKAFVTVHVKAPDEATARRLINDYASDLLEGGEWRGSDRRIFVNSASLDGEHELMEIDGEPVP